jgi:hypothetical protein
MHNIRFHKKCFRGIVKSDKALRILLADKSNEFREIAKGIVYPTYSENWEG